MQATTIEQEIDQLDAKLKLPVKDRMLLFGLHYRKLTGEANFNGGMVKTGIVLDGGKLTLEQVRDALKVEADRRAQLSATAPAPAAVEPAPAASEPTAKIPAPVASTPKPPAPAPAATAPVTGKGRTASTWGGEPAAASPGATGKGRTQTTWNK